MSSYILRRLFLAIPVLLGVSILVFSIVRLVPGEPARAMAGPNATPQFIAQIAEELHLNEPLHVQYGIYMRNLLQGDLGRSTYFRRPVATVLGEKFPNTLRLTITAMFVATVLGMSAGIVSATKRGSILDNASMLGSLIGVAAPVFWLGIMFQIFFSVRLGWFPSGGMEGWQSYVLPSLTLGMASAALISRITRSSMLEVLRSEFIVTARAKGLTERVVIFKHALKSAFIPVVTVMGLQFGTLLGGAVLTEIVFSWDGIGRLMVDAIQNRDYPLVQGAVLLLAVMFVLINISVDIVYAWLDPRISYSSREGE
ncbi:ABC transporter permease [Dethiobacter alkaliphilus]|uniref:Binding-protein-dependent transport systems inner membrane component n=1 Tax=Dethiobacter alkaliphilus AHT 1 TaxID=555088 RepID=C0GGX1_DETAL|nr:ABC transporter permease [Dethiobacter alkaliphilus]EEG77273.1 binding-protein-dependent transport systems inner membrane component [Dethiobacter alkaliphilus AHT 1]